MEPELTIRLLVAVISALSTVLVEILRRRHRRDMRETSVRVSNLEEQVARLLTLNKAAPVVDTRPLVVQGVDRASLRKEQDEWLIRIRGT